MKLLTLLYCVDTGSSHGERISEKNQLHFGHLFILPDAFGFVYAIPEEDADAFGGIKSQRGNLTLCFCGGEIQAEATAIRVVRFLCLNKLSL